MPRGAEDGAVRGAFCRGFDGVRQRVPQKKYHGKSCDRSTLPSKPCCCGRWLLLLLLLLLLQQLLRLLSIKQGIVSLCLSISVKRSSRGRVGNR